MELEHGFDTDGFLVGQGVFHGSSESDRYRKNIVVIGGHRQDTVDRQTDRQTEGQERAMWRNVPMLHGSKGGDV